MQRFLWRFHLLYPVGFSFKHIGVVAVVAGLVQAFPHRFEFLLFFDLGLVLYHGLVASL